MQRTYEAKTQNRLFYDRSLTHGGGVGGGGGGGGGGGVGGGGDQGVNVAGYLDSSQKVSQYLLIHCKALTARIK